ncbi:MAG: hypothetical protein S4CHLAM45_01780 [Chlamydiales bacterium]|nr:hypothetical protein [Chlamydiales bacterium]MCH9619497.1 hypothetical protein [Chlamydiales bacterium]MCH9622301.1 hypothetical protein [Chlamydiales bacterium]
MDPILSVIIPNYNMSSLLNVALQSVFSQTFTRYEIILIDDASTDCSVSQIRKHAKNHPQIRLYENEKNLGAVQSVNRGIKEAQGRYIYFLAADDKILEETFFEKMINHLEQYPNYPMCTTDHGMFLDGSKEIHMWDVFPHLKTFSPLSSEDVVELCASGKRNYWFYAIGTIFRAELFSQQTFRTDFPVLSDWYLIHLFALSYGMLYLPGTYVAWRYRDGNNLYNFMKKNETLNLFKQISKSKKEKALFIRSNLLECYIRQSVRQILMRPSYWCFLKPLIMKKLKKTLSFSQQ